MNEYTTPPSPTTPPSAVPPTPPPPGGGTPWGKIALFGCLGLFLIGLILGGIGVVIYMTRRDEIQTYEVTDGDDGPADVSGGGTTVHRGTLVAGDNLAPDGSWYDEYSVTVGAGDRLVATLESSDFDAYLTVLAPSGAMTSDDDGGGGTNSRVDRIVDEGGNWRIHANTLRPGQTGSYVLTIETM